MSTRALVPNASGEGSLGTADKAWGAMYVNTPATGANDQSVPSTAWVQALVAQAVADAQKQAIFPVGSIYISMTDSRNPSEILGFGTWEALPAGHSLVAVGTATETHGDTTKTFTFEAGKTYGEFEHQLTVGELPFSKTVVTDDAWHPVWGNDANVQSLGLDKKSHITQTPFSIMDPQIGAYIWKRIA